MEDEEEVEDEEERVNDGGMPRGVEGVVWGLERAGGCAGLRRSRTHTRTELACSPRLRLRRSLAI